MPLSTLVFDFTFSLFGVIFVYFWSKSNFVTTNYYGLTDVFNLTSTKISRSTFWLFYPPVYITFLSFLLTWLGKAPLTVNIWFVSVMFWVNLWLYIVVVLDRRLLLNLRILVTYAIFSTFFSVIIYNYGIAGGVNSLLPDGANLRADFWIIFLVFFMGGVTEYLSRIARIETNKSAYIKDKYAELYRKFSYLTSKELGVISNLTYSIMIYENYERPKMFRRAELLLARIGRANTSGIMQVNSDVVLSDEQSIKAALKILKKAYRKALKGGVNEEGRVISLILKIYNCGPDYGDRVKEIYTLLSHK